MYNYLISSDDIEALNNKIEEIYKSFNIEFDSTKYDLEEDNLYSIIDELSTISLFDNPKFLVVKTANNISKASENQIIELLKVMNNPESNNVIVFTSNEKLDFNNDNMAKLRKYSIYFDIRIKNIPLDQYAKNELINRGFQIDAAALTQLVSFSSNMSSLKTNIDILTTYKAEEKKITIDDIVKMIKQPLEDNIFSLIDVVLAKDKKSIYRIYRDLKIENIKSSYIISMLINKFQEMYNVYILARGGADQQAIMDLFNVSSGKAYYMLKNSKQASLDEIKTNLDLLNKLEYDIKSGKIDEEIGLELYLLK